MPSVYVAASLLISVEQTHQVASMGGVGNESPFVFFLVTYARNGDYIGLNSRIRIKKGKG